MGLGKVFFDDLAGADDNAKVRTMNRAALAHGGKPTPQVMFDTREYRISEPIPLVSGLSLRGGDGSPPREFGRRTIIRYTGTGSLFRFGVTQTNQSYPSDGSPRDVNVGGIEFRGGASVDFIEPHPPGTPYQKCTLWYCSFADCGWNGWRTIWHGYGTGTSFATGVSHMQAFSDTALNVGGSENCIFGADGYSFMDSQAPGIAGKPFIRISSSKSSLGQVMVTTRKNMLALQVDGGHGLRVVGFTADSQDSDPAYGANIRVTGNTQDLVIGDGTMKGHMINPASAIGGAGQNRAVIHVDGGTNIVIDRETFLRKGSSLPSVDTPLVYAGPNVPPAGIRVGLTAHSGYSGTLLESRPGQILSTDPTLVTRPA